MVRCDRYEYKGKREQEHLLDYAKGGFKTGPPGVACPTDPTMVKHVRRELSKMAQSFRSIFSNAEKLAIFIAGLVLGSTLATLIIMAVGGVGPSRAAAAPADDATKKQK